jgi:hypothetical protein
MVARPYIVLADVAIHLHEGTRPDKHPTASHALLGAVALQRTVIYVQRRRSHVWPVLAATGVVPTAEPSIAKPAVLSAHKPDCGQVFLESR